MKDDDLASAFRSNSPRVVTGQLGIAGIAREYATIEKAAEGKRFTVRAKTKTSVEVKRGWDEEE